MNEEKKTRFIITRKSDEKKNCHTTNCLMILNEILSKRNENQKPRKQNKKTF